MIYYYPHVVIEMTLCMQTYRDAFARLDDWYDAILWMVDEFGNTYVNNGDWTQDQFLEAIHEFTVAYLKREGFTS